MKEEDKDKKFTKIPAIVVSVMLLLTFFDWPYGYYTLLRIVATAVAIYYAYYFYKILKEHNFWFWGLVAIAIVFNPIIPIYLYNKTTWGLVDVITAVFFISLIIREKKHKRKNEKFNTITR